MGKILNRLSISHPRRMIRNHYHENGDGFTEIQPVAGGLKTPGDQSEDIEGSETENQHPQNAVNIALLFQVFQQKSERERESETGFQPQRRDEHKAQQRGQR